MKKGMILILGILFFSMISVHAASSCSYKEQSELNSMAANIKAAYEVKTGVLDKNSYGKPDSLIGKDIEYTAEYRYFDISILNVTEEIYLVLSTDNGFNRTIRYSDTTNGIYQFNWNDLSQVTTLTIEAYASNKTGCANEKYRVLHLTLPKTNYYALSPLCVDAEEFYLCKELITTAEPSYEVFEKKINDFKAGKLSAEGEDIKTISVNSFIGLINEYRGVVIAISCLLIVGVVTVITLKKKRRIKKK